MFEIRRPRAAAIPGGPSRTSAIDGDLLVRHVGEVAVLAVAASGAGALVGVAGLVAPASDVGLVVTLFLEAAGAAAALLGLITSWWTGDRRVATAGVAIGGYCLLAVPTSTLGTVLDAALPATRATVQLILLALLALVLTAPSWSRARLAAALAGSVGALAAAVVLDAMTHGAAAPLVGGTPWWLTISLSWTATTVALVADTLHRRSWRLGLVGAGLAVLAAAHLEAALQPGAAEPHARPLTVGLLVVGIGLALRGTASLAIRAMRDLDRAHHQQEEDLRLAELRLARARERDHELRSGLAGLAGAAALWDQGPDAHLRGVVLSELHRLDDLLRPGQPSPAAGPAEPPPYAVAPVLDGLIDLRRRAGLDVSAEISAGLTAVGSSATLAQVVSGLIDNAQRHAPGSRVRMAAGRRADRVVVEIRDYGPAAYGRVPHAVAAGSAVAAPGQGLGLPVARRLLGEENGSITLRPAGGRAPGSVAVIDLPAAADVAPRVPSGGAAGVAPSRAS